MNWHKVNFFMTECMSIVSLEELEAKTNQRTALWKGS